MNLFTFSLTLALLFAALAVCTRFVKMLHGLAFTFSVLAVGSAAVAYPPLFIAWGGFELKQAITPLVQLILLGMGMTLTVGDFRRVVTMPRAIVIGFVLQFTVMPLGGLLFAWLFGLTGAVATGLILIGSVPGGTASNVITLLARGNVPLSVTMTACSTLLSPVMTPLAMKLLAGTFVPIDAWAMMQSILTMIIVPLVVGLAIHHFLPVLAALCAVAATGGDGRHLPGDRHHGGRVARGVAHRGHRVVRRGGVPQCCRISARFRDRAGRWAESHRLANGRHRGRHAKRRHGDRAGVRRSAESGRRAGRGGVRAVERGDQLRAGVVVETKDPCGRGVIAMNFW